MNSKRRNKTSEQAVKICEAWRKFLFFRNSESSAINAEYAQSAIAIGMRKSGSYFSRYQPKLNSLIEYCASPTENNLTKNKGIRAAFRSASIIDITVDFTIFISCSSALSLIEYSLTV